MAGISARVVVLAAWPTSRSLPLPRRLMMGWQPLRMYYVYSVLRLDTNPYIKLHNIHL